jgi:hypothetical protein
MYEKMVCRYGEVVVVVNNILETRDIRVKYIGFD